MKFGVPFRLALGVSSLLSTPALAASADIPELRYQAPPTCPSRAEFSAFVAARTHAWLAPASPFAVMIQIEPSADGERFVGDVTFVRAAHETVRQLNSPRCEELARALALIVAILLDPALSQQAPPVKVVTPRPAPTSPTFKPAPPPWLVAGVGAELVTSLLGEPSFGERIFVGAGRGAGSLWLSSASLSFSRVFDHATSSESGARAEFELWAARLDGCVARAANGLLGIEPCVFFEAGQLHALGLHPSGDVTRIEPWATTGILLRPTLTLARRLVIGAELGLHLPLTRYRFAFTGEPPLYETAVVGFNGALGLGVRFP